MVIRTLKRDNHPAAQNVLEQMESYMDMSASDYTTEDDSDSDNSKVNKDDVQKMIQPMTSYRYVYRLNINLSLSKMKRDSTHRKYFLRNHADISDQSGTSDIEIDDSDDDDNDIVTENQSSVVDTSTKQEHNLDDIREKTLEYEQRQVKGIQFANAGANNVKIINNYALTSKTCMIL